MSTAVEPHGTARVADVRLCTCPRDRNGLGCPVHVRDNPAVQRLISECPLFVRTAWEFDLHWATDRASRLFWQHTRNDGWPM